MKVKKEDKLPEILYVIRDWDESDENASGAFDARKTPEAHAMQDRDILIGVYELTGYVVARNTTTIVPAK